MRAKLTKITQAATFGIALALTFSCSSDDGDGGDGGGGSCGTVKIGAQTWQKCNLSVETINGNSRCYDSDNCEKYGRLYDWATAMALPSSCNNSSCESQITNPHQGICQTGWHIPSSDEWSALITDAGSSDKLRATSGWENSNGNGTNSSGFSALPISINEEGIEIGYWWGANEYKNEDNDGSDRAYIQVIHTRGTDFRRYTKSGEYSVRCVKDVRR